MNQACEVVQSVLIDYLDGQLDPSTREEVRRHIAGCADCTRELEEFRRTMEAIVRDPIELPGPALRESFYAALQAELNVQETAVILKKNKEARVVVWQALAPLGRLVAACLILAIGFAAGYLVFGRKDETSTQIAQLHNQLNTINEKLMFTQLRDESAAERIKAVSYAEQLTQPDQRIIGALETTLNGDRNVNVRLAALYSLARFTDLPSVTDSLVSSLGRQTEPIIQIVLMNILTEKKDVKAIGPMQQILRSDKSRPEVKEMARKGLQSL